MKTLLLSLAFVTGLAAAQPFQVKVTGHGPAQAFQVKVTGPASAQPFQVKATGHGPAMILIPGLSCPGEVWDSTVAHYQDRYQIHVLSLAGFAGVPRVAGPLIENAREGLAAYIRTNHLEKPVIVGHSLGGFLALDLAASHPDLPGKLVIVDSYPFFAGLADPDATPEKAKANAEMMRKGMEAQSQEDYNRFVKSGVATRAMVTKDSDLDRIIAWSLASDRGAVADAMGALFGADLRADLARIQSPTLVMGTWIGFKQYTDRARTEASLRRQYAKLTGVEIEVTDTARHFIMWDDPDWMFGQMDRFLSR
jgi:pimeloyl-ACP methyl ester carboxylesterase